MSGPTVPTSRSTSAGTEAPPPSEFGNNTTKGDAEQAGKNAAGSGADDSLLLVALLLGFTLAVGGMVLVAGRRGGHRVH